MIDYIIYIFAGMGVLYVVHRVYWMYTKELKDALKLFRTIKQEEQR